MLDALPMIFWPGGSTEAPLPVNEIAKYSGFGKH